MKSYHGKSTEATVNMPEIVIPQRVLAQLPEIVTSVREGLLGLMVRTGLAVLNVMLEEEITEVVGPRGAHNAERSAYRHGSETTPVVLGGQKITVPKPRIQKKGGGELQLKTLDDFRCEDMLDETAVTKMLLGVSTRKYKKSLDVASIEGIEPQSVSKSAVSRRFIQRTQQAFEELMSRNLSGATYPVIMVDGYAAGDHMVLAVLGVDSEGHKHILGIREGAVENAAVCRELLADIVDRGLDFRGGLLVVIDGSKALRRAVRDVFGGKALVQRCQVHKLRNVLEHLPENKRAEVKRQIKQAWLQTSYDTAWKLLRNLANQLEHQHPGAAASLSEGLEEALTVMKLGLPGKLRITLRSTNPLESSFDGATGYIRNVKTWKNGNQVVRWMSAALMEVEKQYRRLVGYREMPILMDALTRHTTTVTVAKETSDLATA